MLLLLLLLLLLGAWVGTSRETVVMMRLVVQLWRQLKEIIIVVVVVFVFPHIDVSTGPPVRPAAIPVRPSAPSLTPPLLSYSPAKTVFSRSLPPRLKRKWRLLPIMIRRRGVQWGPTRMPGGRMSGRHRWRRMSWRISRRYSEAFRIHQSRKFITPSDRPPWWAVVLVVRANLL